MSWYYEVVLKEVFECLQYAECYVDNTNEIKETIGYSMIYNMNPILLRRFTPKRFAFFGLHFLHLYLKILLT